MAESAARCVDETAARRESTQQPSGTMRQREGGATKGRREAARFYRGCLSNFWRGGMVKYVRCEEVGRSILD